MKNQVKVTKDQLKSLLLDWHYGAQPASVQYITDPNWVNVEAKRNFCNIKKIANVNCFLGAIYENSVNNELEREGKERDFIAKPLWNGKGQRVNGVLAFHPEKNEYYLSIKPQRTLKSIFFDTEKLDIVSKDAISNFLKPYVAPENQGVNEGKEIPHREITLSNIRRLKFKKTTYVLV